MACKWYNDSHPLTLGCRDAMSGCPEWSSEGYCTKPNYKEYMLYYCPLSCKVCDIQPVIAGDQGGEELFFKSSF